MYTLSLSGRGGARAARRAPALKLVRVRTRTSFPLPAPALEAVPVLLLTPAGTREQARVHRAAHAVLGKVRVAVGVRVRARVRARARVG